MGFAIVKRIIAKVILIAGAICTPSPAVFAEPPATVPTTERATSQPSTTRATKPAQSPYDPTAPLPLKPGFHKLKFQTKVGGKTEKMAWLLYLPAGYKPAHAGPPAPVLVFLHGAGEGGDDLSGIYLHGPARDLIDPHETALRDSFPFIGVFPQCPPRGQRWDQPSMVKQVTALLDEILPKLNADEDRVYLTGLSMGGKGTWFVALDTPSRFAAIAPICADTAKPDSVEKLRYTSVLGIVGSDDGVHTDGTLAIAKMMRAAGEDHRLILLPHEGHGIWQQCYSSPQLYEWLLQHHRLTAGEKDQREMQIARATVTPPASEASTKAVDPPILLANGTYDPTASPDPPLPKEPGRHLLHHILKYGDSTIDLPYEVYLPPGYDSHNAAPMLLFLHDTSAIGMLKDGMFLHGVDAALEASGNAALKERLPLVIVSPQCPPGMGGWGRAPMQEALGCLLQFVQREYSVDQQQIYLGGQRGGAVGAYKLAAATPGKFAAVWLTLADEKLPPLPPAGPDLSIWPAVICWSINDNPAINALKEALASAGVAVVTRVLPKADPGTLSEAYNDPESYDWLLKQTRAKKTKSPVGTD